MKRYWPLSYPVACNGAGGPCRAAGPRCTTPSTSPPADGARPRRLIRPWRRPPRRTRAHKRRRPLWRRTAPDRRARCPPQRRRTSPDRSATRPASGSTPGHNPAHSGGGGRTARRAGSPRGQGGYALWSPSQRHRRKVGEGCQEWPFSFLFLVCGWVGDQMYSGGGGAESRAPAWMFYTFVWQQPSCMPVYRLKGSWLCGLGLGLRGTVNSFF